MGIVRKSVPPPNVSQDDVFEATLNDVRIVDSQFTDDDGTPQQQLRFDFEIDGYPGRSWIRYYERPSDRTYYGQLVLQLQRLFRREYEHTEDVFNDLKNLGRLFVRVSGFHTFNGQRHPKFKVVPSKLPSRQTSTAHWPT
jgi:hypothetical protein